MTAQDAPSVLVPRRHRVEVSERVDADGQVVVPLAMGELEGIVQQFRDWQVQAIAVSLMFSFINDEHERAIGEHLHRAHQVGAVRAGRR